MISPGEAEENLSKEKGIREFAFSFLLLSLAECYSDFPFVLSLVFFFASLRPGGTG